MGLTLFKLVGSFCLVVSAAIPQSPPTLAVHGIGGSSATLSLAGLSKLPQHTVKTTDHATPVEFEGVLLQDVLAKVDLPLGEKFHPTVASYYVTIEAKAGYRAVFAWAEVDSSFMDKSIYLVTERDGKPLAGKDGPFQLVVPGEKRGGRWVRQAAAINVLKAS